MSLQSAHYDSANGVLTVIVRGVTFTFTRAEYDATPVGQRAALLRSWRDQVWADDIARKIAGTYSIDRVGIEIMLTWENG